MLQLKQARSLVSQVQRSISKAASSATPQDVHRLRTSIRRLEAVTGNLVRKSKHDKKLAASLKRLRKRAGDIRDLDVQSAALRSLYIGSASQEKQQLQRALDRRRRKQMDKLRNEIDKAVHNGLSSRLKDFKRALEVPSVGKRSKIREGQPLEDARRMLRELAAGKPAPSVSELHEFRLACKRIRYIAELDSSPAGESLVDDLKHVQDAIGDWHDWLNLLHAGEEELATGVDRANPPILNAIANMTRVRLNRARAAVNELRLSIQQSAPAAGSKPPARHPARAAGPVSRSKLTA